MASTSSSSSSHEWYLKVEDDFIYLYKEQRKLAAVKSLSLAERDGQSMLKVSNLAELE